MADSGEGPGGGPTLLFLDQLRPEGPKKFVLETRPLLIWGSGWPGCPPPYIVSQGLDLALLSNSVVHDKLFQCLKRFIYLLYKIFYLWQLSSIDRYFLGILAMFLRQKFGYIVFHLTCLKTPCITEFPMITFWGIFEVIMKESWGRRNSFCLFCAPH